MQGSGNPRPQGRRAGHELHLRDSTPIYPHPNFRTTMWEVHVGLGTLRSLRWQPPRARGEAGAAGSTDQARVGTPVGRAWS